MSDAAHDQSPGRSGGKKRGVTADAKNPSGVTNNPSGISAPATPAVDQPASASAAEPTFEAALERLESIVENLENGDVPLADLLSRYEEASGLLKQCQQQLDQAQLRIEKLSRKGDASLELEAFSPDE